MESSPDFKLDEPAFIYSHIDVGGFVWEVISPFDISSSTKNSRHENTKTKGLSLKTKNGSAGSQMDWLIQNCTFGRSILCLVLHISTLQDK